MPAVGARRGLRGAHFRPKTPSASQQAARELMTATSRDGLPASPADNDDCPLLATVQSRNILCYAGFWCIYYLAAPVSYVGVLHSNFLKELGNSDTVANLPHAVYQWCTAVPILAAWLFPRPKMLKPLLIAPQLAMAAGTAAVAIAIWQGLAPATLTYFVIAHGAVFGASGGVMLTTLWEVLRRGVSTSRRGRALGLAFGIGPLMACLGALAQQALSSGPTVGVLSAGFEFPQNYLVMFAAAAPLFLLTAGACSLFVLPLPSDEETRFSLADEIIGSVRIFAASRPLLLGAIAYLLVYSGGNAIFDNVSMHAKEVLGEDKGGTMGVQNLLRFGFKAIAGAWLGWLLAKTSPKAPLLATTGILLFGMAWALNASGWWYLLSAGILGAGELFGAFFPNYIATASPKSRVRVNMAYLNLLGALVGFASVLFGVIADEYGRIASFRTATGLLIIAFVLVALLLPANPTPRGAADSAD